MLIDAERPATLAAWIAQRPGVHAAQLAALAALPLWARWREAMLEALRAQEGSP